MSSTGFVENSIPPATWKGFFQQLAAALGAVAGVWLLGLLCDVFDALMYCRASRSAAKDGREDAVEARLGRTAFIARLQLHMDASKSALARVLDILDVFGGLLMLIVYVVRSYRGNDWDNELDITETICATLFIIDLACHFVVAEAGRRARWARALPQVINVLTIAYSLFSITDAFPGQMTLTYLRVVLVQERFQRFDALVLAPAKVITDVSRHLLVMAFSTLSLVMLFASTVLTLENLGNPEAFDGVASDDGHWTFYRAFYFVFVTISTVGYGDFSAESVLGRFSVIVFIVGGIIFFSVQTGRLVELLREEGVGTGSYTNRKDGLFVIVTGDLTDDILDSFLAEFYHADHLGARLNMHVVVLTGEYSIETRRRLLNQPQYRKRVKYLKGSVFSRDDLIRRCAGEEADALFVLTHKFSQDDAANMLRILAIKRFIPGTPVYASLNQASNLPLLKAAGVPPESVCRVDELKMGLLAQNVMTPGVSTLVANLLGSNVVPDNLEAKFLGDSADLHWHDEYVLGLAQEIYEIEVPAPLVGMSFKEAALAVYDTSIRYGKGHQQVRCGATLFGIGRLPEATSAASSGLKSDVMWDLRSENTFKIQAEDSMFLLCEDFHMLQSSLSHLSDFLGSADPVAAEIKSSGLSRTISKHVHKDIAFATQDSMASKTLNKLLLKRRAAKRGVDLDDVIDVDEKDAESSEESDHSSEDDADEASDLRAELDDEEFKRAAKHLRKIRKKHGAGKYEGVQLSNLLRAKAADVFADGVLDAAAAAAAGAAAPAGEPVDPEMDAIRELLPACAELPSMAPERPPELISDHIVVCGGGWTDWIALFLEPLRRSTDRPVVVIDAEDPSAYWAKLVRYRPIYFVQGSVVSMFDLVKRARVLHAHRVLILGARPERVPRDFNEMHMGDSEAAFCTLMLENRLSKYNHRLTYGTTTEFLVDANVKFLQSSDEIAVAEAVATSDSLWASLSLAELTGAPQTNGPQGGRNARQRKSSGHDTEVVSSAAAATKTPAARASLVRRTGSTASVAAEKRKRPSMSIGVPPARPAGIGPGAGGGEAAAAAVKAFVKRLGEEQLYDNETAEQFDRSARYAAGKLFGSGSILSVLVQAFFNPCVIHLAHAFAMGKNVTVRHIRVPEGFANSRYDALHHELVREHNVVPLGLFRDKDKTDAALPYVFANPPASTTVYEGDLVFVLVPPGWQQRQKSFPPTDPLLGGIKLGEATSGGAAVSESDERVPPRASEAAAVAAVGESSAAEAATVEAPMAVAPPPPPPVTE